MAIAEVIEFKGSPDVLVWKHPAENFNTTSQLIVDETHEALFVANGVAADLFGPGRRTLTTANLPILNKIINIPTGGKTPFPCKVFFVTKVHQMDMRWGTQSAITLEDPLYDVFMNVMLHGSMSVSVDDTRKFLLKLVGFRDSFTTEAMIAKFRGIISSHVKDCISKIMIDGKLSYFMISSSLLEISNVVKERLDKIFEDYGVIIEFFNIEAIEVPEKDYAEVSAAKKMRTSRLIQGYTWQEERQAMIMEKFAANEGTMGGMGGMMGGAMGGIVMGTTISEVARNALSPENAGVDHSRKDVSGVQSAMGVNSGGVTGGFDVSGFLGGVGQRQSQQPTPGPAGEPSEGTVSVMGGTKFCTNCGASISASAKFCPECGQPQARTTCPGCGSPIKPEMRFCPECGYKLK